MKKILLTTSNYPPELGGISTFTKNIESCLRDLGYEVGLFHWRSLLELSKLRSYYKEDWDFIWHIHPYAAAISTNGIPSGCFIHGTEILFTSPNIAKRIFKFFFKPFVFVGLRRSKWNIFISQFTAEKIQDLGYSYSYERDLVYHNCINTKGAAYNEKDLQDEQIIFSCFVRDIPHKNFQGMIHFLRKFRELTNKKIIFYTSVRQSEVIEGIEFCDSVGVDDNIRDKIMAKSHFHLLMSLDHSSKGFFEGFGLAVLEAGIFGTPTIALDQAGLQESVHFETGWKFHKIDRDAIKSWWEGLDSASYSQKRKNVFDHTLKTHGLDQYKRLFSLLGSLE